MARGRYFSLYDIEQFLKEAGSERINESAVMTLEKELEDTVKAWVDDAQVYANYAGRSRLVRSADLEFATVPQRRRVPMLFNGAKARRTNGHRRVSALRAKARITNPASSTHM